MTRLTAVFFLAARTELKSKEQLICAVKEVVAKEKLPDDPRTGSALDEYARELAVEAISLRETIYALTGTRPAVVSKSGAY